MTETLLNSVVKDSIMTALKISLPILIVVLLLGLIISILQATTQVQEQTLTFVPKLIATAFVGIFLGSWMLHTMMSFTKRIFDLVSKIAG